MALKGSREIRARLRAIRQSFKPIGKRWADDTARRAQRYAPVRSGKLKRSIKRKNASQKKASVKAIWYSSMVTGGAKEHAIKPRRFKAVRFETGGTVFVRKAVKHPGVRHKNTFARRAAEEALARDHPLQEVLRAWNEAA